MSPSHNESSNPFFALDDHSNHFFDSSHHFNNPNYGHGFPLHFSNANSNSSTFNNHFDLKRARFNSQQLLQKSKAISNIK